MSEQKRRPAHLVLHDGTVFSGVSSGSPSFAFGEVVFNTSMTGYQEILTDPSYAGQIVVMTFPLIGNYGISPDVIESAKIRVAGFVSRETCDDPSHWRSRGSVSAYLDEANIPYLTGVDTRALTRKLRSGGVLMGAIGIDPPADLLARLLDLPSYADLDLVHQVTTPGRYDWPAPAEPRGRIVIVDTGLKFNIARALAVRGYESVVLPCDVDARQILAASPDGVIFSPGPGDPQQLGRLVTAAGDLIGRLPVMGICLGHQVIGQVFGAGTYKLKFGHHGGNHPVKDLESGAVHITTQNHGYALDPSGLRDGAQMSHVNLNDGTCEGLRHHDLPVLSIQYHSEAGPGPRDNEYLFDRFLKLVQQEAR